MADRLKHWGWGHESRDLDRSALEAMAPMVRERLGFDAQAPEDPVPLDAIALGKPRIQAPASLAAIVSDDPYERISHALGKAYRDVVRGMRGEFADVPDLVARPRNEADVERLLGWCSDTGVAAIPFGGGTSVCGGIEPRFPSEYPGALTIDLRALDQLLEVDEASQSALIEAGATGPGFERQLGERGLTMRCYPQSFEFSTLGGWIATRAGGHFATRQTHVDDLVQSVRAVTPSGMWESRRLPGSGAGPSPDRMLIGSEGILGVITRAWVRVRPRPTIKAARAVAFDSFTAGAEAVRELSQSGLDPANCRLLDATESRFNQAGPEGMAMLMLGFESSHHAVEGDLDFALDVARAHGGQPQPEAGKDGDSVGAWRDAFLAMPYLRDGLVRLGVLSETFETAITWDRFEPLHSAAMAAAREALGAEAMVSCRFTHVYPDGPAPYFTVLAPARRGSEVEQWDEAKAAVSEALLSAGGTITHHHAVGRDHRPWYDRQRPDPFARALIAAKREVDPVGILNPGVLIDPADQPHQ
ncbi:MAG: FAD-binding oxidoreductase [Actinomycetota bacterium]|nr:FAD-binding oxidoreductase [Actinomycetota bacterium]